MPIHKRDVLIHLQYMQSVTGGHLTTVEGWSRSHGLPYECIQACNILTDGSAIFLLKDVCFTELELKSILPALEYVTVLSQPYNSYLLSQLESLKYRLRCGYDAHLRQNDEQKKKTTGPEPKLCDVLFHHEYAKAVGWTLERFVATYVEYYAGSDAVMVHGCHVEVTRLKSCKLKQSVEPCYALYIPENKQPFSDATKLHNMYKRHRQIKAMPFTVPDASMFTWDGAKTHRTSSRKPAKTLQQEHAARVAHFEAEAEKKKSMGEMDLDPKFCQNLLDGMHYLTRQTPSHWSVFCASQREYDFAVHSIAQWATRCGKEGVTTIASKSLVYIKVGNNQITLFKSWN